MSKFKAGKWGGPARSNTETSVRGKIISNPIPIPDDDEFPMRTPGASIATPLDSDFEARTVRRMSGSLTLEDPPAHQTGIAISDFTDQPNGIQVQPGPESSPGAPFKRTNKPSALRNSVTSEQLGSTGKPERKKSGLRHAFRKLFGKRKGSVSSSREEQNSSETRAGQHRSDPIALRSPRGAGESTQKRSASLPINEYNRALRSHSIVAEDLPRNSGSTKRDSVQTPTERHGRPRRATTPSRLWTPSRAPGYVDWTGLSPRPVSSHPRGSRIVSAAEADAAIGTAITSGSHPDRRSRSLGELRNAPGGPLVLRRRSDEIRYWRESYDPGVLSPMSSNKPDLEEPIVLDEENKQNEEPQEQPQPFNFGPLGELAGMKITQAASLESRVRRLEERCLSMETVIYPNPRPRAGSRGEPLRLQDPPRGTRNSSQTRPRTNDLDFPLPRYPRNRTPQKETPLEAPYNGQIRSSSYGSRPSMVANNSYHPTPDTATPQSSASEEKTPRALSQSTTVRSFPTGPITMESLMAMILSEQAARQDLEIQVRSLQQQLVSLRSQSSAPTSYPTPDSDRYRMSNSLQMVGANESERRSAGQYSGFEMEESSDEEGGTDTGGEVFNTPGEGPGFGDSIFGGESRESVSGDGGTGEKRTLSLSQITMQKGLQPSVNF